MQKSTLCEMKKKMKGFLITDKSQDKSTSEDQFFEFYEEIPETLYQSAYYSIKLAKEKKTQKLFACKIIYINDLELQMAVNQEYANIQAAQGHPNIIKCFAKFENEQKAQIRIIMEHLEGYQPLQNLITNSTCSGYLQTISFIFFLEQQIGKIIYQVLEALAFLHSKFIAHRNICPSNILVNKEFEVKLTDFTVSKLFLGDNNEPRTMLTPLGQNIYSAPDVISFIDFGYTEKVDIWPLGIIILEALFQQKPIKNTSKFNNFILTNIIISVQKLEKNIQQFLEDNESVLQADLLILLKSFLQTDMNLRISAKKALENLWIIKNSKVEI